MILLIHTNFFSIFLANGFSLSIIAEMEIKIRAVARSGKRINTHWRGFLNGWINLTLPGTGYGVPALKLHT